MKQGSNQYRIQGMKIRGRCAPNLSTSEMFFIFSVWTDVTYEAVAAANWCVWTGVRVADEQKRRSRGTAERALERPAGFEEPALRFGEAD